MRSARPLADRSLLAPWWLAVLCIVIWYLPPLPAVAQPMVTGDIVMAGQVAAPAELLELRDQSRLRVSINGMEKGISLDEVCRWGEAVPPKRFPVLLLTDGSQIVFRRLERQKDQLVIQSDLWESITIPESFVRGIVTTSPGSNENWYTLLDRMNAATGRNDQVLLRDRGWIEGIFQRSDSEKDPLEEVATEQLRVDGKDVAIPATNIEAITFSPVLTPLTSTKSGAKVGLKDGSLLNCSQWRVIQPGDYFELTLRCGISLKSLDQSSAFTKSIHFLSNHPRQITFLSDKEASSYKHIDWLTNKWPLGRDRDLMGRRLQGKQGTIEKGLAMHATSQAAFRWDKSPGQFLAAVKLAPTAEPGLTNRGNAIAKVMALKAGKLETLYTSAAIQVNSPPENISLSIDGAELIILIVDAGSDGTLGDHVLWLDSRISK
jgi:hypothetical protein